MDPESGPDKAAGNGHEETVYRAPTHVDTGMVLNGLYRIVRRIGAGGMGEVFEAVNIADDEREAIKVISAAVASQPKAEALFRKEAKLLRRLAAPEVAQLRFFGRDPDLEVLYLVTEFVDGPPLTSRIQGTPAPVADVITLLRRVARGLKAAHDLDLVHRDISPDNILLPDNRLDRAKIIDFGIAKDTTAGAQTIIGDGFAGRLDFAAPELFMSGTVAVGPWSDIYSLGLVAVAFARGEPLDMGKTIPTAYVARQKPLDLTGAPAALRPLFDRMLTATPETRISSMDELLVALDELERGKAPAAVAPPPPPPPPAPPPPSESGGPARVVGAPPVSSPPDYAPQGFVSQPPPSGYSQREEAPPPSNTKWIILGLLGALALIVAVLFGTGVLNPSGGSTSGSGNVMEPVIDPDAGKKEQSFYTVRDVNLQAQPGKGDGVGKLGRNAAVTGIVVEGLTDPEELWVKITQGPNTGRFVWARNLTGEARPELDKSKAGEMFVMADTIVQDKPEPNAAQLYRKGQSVPVKLLAGEQVDVAGAANDWAEVRLKGGGVGYVPWSSFADPAQEAAMAAEAAAAAAGAATDAAVGSGHQILVANNCANTLPLSLYYRDENGVWTDSGGGTWTFNGYERSYPTHQGRRMKATTTDIYYASATADGRALSHNTGSFTFTYGGVAVKMRKANIEYANNGDYVLNFNCN